MKKIFVIGLAIVLVLGLSGLAMANTVDIDQNAGATANPNTGLYNDTYVEQDGQYHTVDINQVANTGWNYAKVVQIGQHHKKTVIDQVAQTYNNAVVDLDIAGNWVEVNFYQRANGSYNTASFDNGGGYLYDDVVDIDQVAGLFNEANVAMSGATSYGRVAVNQNALGGYNTLNVVVSHGAMITQAFSNGSISTALYPALPAVQNSANGSNDFTVYQTGSNTFGLYQEADGNNYAFVEQYGGNNTLGVYQVSSGGSNTLTAYQTGNMSATVVQTTSSGNSALNITQN